MNRATLITLKHKVIILIKVLIIFLATSINSHAENPKVVIGSDNAPVKIKIFSSLTCPHCADFHTKIVPELKKNYVETGKVQLIFVDFPLDQAALNASILLHFVECI